MSYDGPGDAAKYDHHISLVDHTQPSDSELEQAPTAVDEPESSSDPRSSDGSLSKRGTRGTLRHELTKRKYARWQEDKIIGKPKSQQGVTTTEAEVPGEDGVGMVPQAVITRSSTVKSKLSRGRQKVSSMVHRRGIISVSGTGEDSELDILYENQRGWFLFGVPFFSANSLMPIDPKPWLTGQLHTSPCDITSAQVPDPSWEWAWKTWYVDMSRDVDEEGWEYSFSFQKGFAWHGTHPWFHSFVRRRRWVRLRVKRGAMPRKKKADTALSEAHKLNDDYFTIHTARRQSGTISTVGSSERGASGNRLTRQKHEEEAGEEPGEDVKDVPTLLRRLKKAAIDREKMVLVQKFLEDGDEELYYLADQIPTIMSLFVFQNSRRQLLASLMDEYNRASSSKGKSGSDDQHNGGDDRRVENLKRAVKAADKETKKLEYWSDIRHMATMGETYAGTTEQWGPGWQGVDSSGPAVTDFHDGASPGHELHGSKSYPELREARQEYGGTADGGNGSAGPSQPDMQKSRVQDKPVLHSQFQSRDEHLEKSYFEQAFW